MSCNVMSRHFMTCVVSGVKSISHKHGEELSDFNHVRAQYRTEQNRTEQNHIEGSKRKLQYID